MVFLLTFDFFFIYKIKNCRLHEHVVKRHRSLIYALMKKTLVIFHCTQKLVDKSTFTVYNKNTQQMCQTLTIEYYKIIGSCHENTQQMCRTLPIENCKIIGSCHVTLSPIRHISTSGHNRKSITVCINDMKI